FHARAVMELRYHEHTALSAPAFAVLIWCFVAVCVTYVFGTLITASGDLRTLNKLTVGGMVLNIGLNIALIPQYHALGAAWASLITQAGMAAAQMLVATRRFPLRASAADLLGTAVYLLLLLGVAWGLRERAVQFPQVLLPWAGTAVVGSLATGLLPVRRLRALLLMREDA